jgi:hypothetical protein
MVGKIEAFKFLPAQYVDDFLNTGTVKLGAAAEFRAIEGSAGGLGDENELRQIWDMEGEHALKNDDPLFREVWGMPPAAANMNGLKIIGAPGAVVNLNIDALIYCASTEINDEMKARMATDFGADACVRIADFAEFTRLISQDHQIRSEMKQAGAGVVQYVDSKRVKRFLGARPFEKEKAFGWQKELRALWDMNPAPKTSKIISVPAIAPLLTREF